MLLQHVLAVVREVFMPEPMVIPDRAVPYILFQRTAYLRLPVTLLYRYIFRFLPVRTPLYNLAVAIESHFQPDRVKVLYAYDMLQEYDTVKHLLRSNVHSCCTDQ